MLLPKVILFLPAKSKSSSCTTSWSTLGGVSLFYFAHSSVQWYLIVTLFYFLNIFYWLCYYSCPNSSPLPPSAWYPPIPPLSSCPWVVRIGSLASPFPILFLTSPCIFCTYQLHFIIPTPFPHYPPSPSQLISLQMISIPMILFLF